MLAAIQVSPEAASGGTIGKIKDGDTVSVDSRLGLLSVASDGDDPASRTVRSHDLASGHAGMGRELFSAFRTNVSSAESGASVFGGN